MQFLWACGIGKKIRITPEGVRVCRFLKNKNHMDFMEVKHYE